MFRISLIVCVSLICGITAKSLKPWEEQVADTAFQDTVVSIDANGKMALEVQVEPPQDMDETDFDFDPSMAIWKSMTGTGQDGQYQRAEEDKDELHHASMADLVKARLQMPDIAKYTQELEVGTDDIARPPEPEEDWDEVYHGARAELGEQLAPLVAKVNEVAQVRPVHTEPEEDEDDLYHSDPNSAVQVETLGREVREEVQVRVHLEPEEDMDDIYHMDPQNPIPEQVDANAAMPVDQPSQRKHTEPEEDLDDLYHQ